MKQTSIKIYLLFIFLATLGLTACKKDALKIDEEKTFLQADFKFDPSFPYNGGWQVTLKPDKKALILPGGDAVSNGTYKISGKNLTIKSDDKTYNFKILSDTEIQDKEYGIVLRLEK